MASAMGKGRERSVMQIFFLTVQQRLKIRIPVTPEFTAIVRGHGKTKTYLYRFNLTDNPICPCNEGEQSVEHLIHVRRMQYLVRVGKFSAGM